MRIVRFLSESGPEWGSVVEDEICRLPRGPFEALDPGPPICRLDDVDLLASAQPSKIICVGRNYAAHAEEHGADVPEEPLLFLKPPSSLVAPGAAIVLPELSSRVEHESELALIIGRRCRSVSVEKAWSHVFGITCGNDVTARDLQRSDAQWTRGKGFDTFCPLGPWIVTGLAEHEVGGLDVSCTVNGVERQHANTALMVFSPAFLVSYISQVMTLEPGDVVMTGTPSGVGPLHSGDELTVEVERVGRLTNPVE